MHIKQLAFSLAMVIILELWSIKSDIMAVCAMMAVVQTDVMVFIYFYQFSQKTRSYRRVNL